jgi:hypothetical protein
MPDPPVFCQNALLFPQRADRLQVFEVPVRSCPSVLSVTSCSISAVEVPVPVLGHLPRATLHAPCISLHCNTHTPPATKPSGPNIGRQGFTTFRHQFVASPFARKQHKPRSQFQFGLSLSPPLPLSQSVCPSVLSAASCSNWDRFSRLVTVDLANLAWPVAAVRFATPARTPRRPDKKV